jgi:hypothetical protein
VNVAFYFQRRYYGGAVTRKIAAAV